MKTVSGLRRRGTMLPMLAVSATGLFGVIALAIDIGVVAIARTNCQNAADSGALAGARMLNNKTGVTENDKTLALATAKDAVKLNSYMRTKFVDSNMPGAADVKVGVYDYNSTTATFAVSYPGTKPAGKSWTAMQVSLTTSNPTFFARVLGVTTMPAKAVATAVHRPRDVAFVLDLSGSMGFGSYHHWPYDINEGTNIQGLMNPDPHYPKFGHYARYTHYNNASTNVSDVPSSTPSTRPNPLQNFNFASSEVGPNNITMESRGGPPIVEDFFEAVGNPATINNSTTWKNAFKRWEPSQTAAANPVTLTPPTFDYSGYDAATAATPAPENFADQSDTPIPYVGDKWPRTDGSRGAGTAAWSSLSGSSFTDNGAKTLKEFLGYTLTTAAGRALSTINKPTGGVATPLTPSGKDGSNADSSYLDALWERYGYDMDVLNFRGLTTSPKTVSLLATGSRFKGYSMGPRYWGKTFFVWPPDPRYGADTDAGGGTPNPTNLSTTSTVQDASGNWICDWRRRFFLRGDGAAFNPQTDNINTILFSTSMGHVFNTVTTSTGTGGVTGTPGYYRINYTAIMKWLKSGAVVLPENLRAGRILYYSSMPDDISESGAGNAQDKRFWRHYIHFVLGIAQYDTTNYPVANWTYSANRMLAGVESNFPFGTLAVTNTTTFTPTPTPITSSSRSSSTITITTSAAHGLTTGTSVTIAGHSVSAYNGSRTITSVPTPTTFTFTLVTTSGSGTGGTVSAANRKPYMCYTDNINRPRAHLWFGGMTMTMFIERCQLSRQWYAGTVHEAQCWQLKAAMTSAINDIKANHPNDWVGMSYFSNKTEWMKPIVPMGQDYFSMKNTLYFPKATVTALKTNPSATNEDRPYTSTLGNDSADIPNGNGGTDPNSGLAIAYNLLSTSTSLSATDYGSYARRGAAKVVIFETDGVPNTINNWTITGTGTNTYYQNTGTAAQWSGDSLLPAAGKAGVAVASRITAAVSTTGVSGYSTSTTPARVHSIGFGDLFNDYNGSNYSSCSTACKDALRFLLRVQQVGNTSPSGEPGTVMIPYNNVITGPYQRPYPSLPINASTNPAGRIEKLRSCMEAIMQSGIQVVLIQ